MIFFILFSLSFFVCCVWFYVKWRRVRRYWLDRGVPHHPPHPILGSLTFLLKENPAYWMRRIYRDFQAPYVGIWLFWRPGLVVNSPELARRVLVKDADVFRNRFVSSGKTDPVGAFNIFTVNDHFWTLLRRRLSPVYTAAKVRSFDGITISKSKALVNRIALDSKKGDPIDLRKICTDYSTDVIGEASFGVSSNCTAEGHSVIRQVTKEFMEFSLHRGLSWSSIFFYPELVDTFRFSFFPRKTLKLLRKIMFTMIEQRGGFEREVKDPQDLLDALVKIKQEGERDNEDISEDLLLAQGAAFLLAGSDSTGTALSLLIYELAWNPQYQERLYQDVLSLKKQIGNRNFDSTVLNGIPYIDCAFKETLRIYPPMGWLDRMASKDYKIDDKLTIPAGTPVYVNGVGIQMDPKYYPEPEVFNPDRFLDNERDITPYTFLPFGDGPRNCIGMRYGFLAVRQAMADLLLNYEFKLLPNATKPSAVKFEKNGLFFMPKEKISVQFVRRDNEFVSV